ncbi:MAG: hemerythrin domain-containing protein [Deltaproteobacteria bacterium]|nr:hemerythrin domain-containing protein [Deltaproteobacteria bacterium]
MNALALLKKQHDEVDALIARIETASKAKDTRRKQAAFLQLADNLAAHVKIEETIFYPAVTAKQLEDTLLESLEEHLSIKRVLTDLLEIDIDDPRFDAKLSVMKETNEHHTREEEEKELFPEVAKLLDSNELERLGDEMLAKFESLMMGAPRDKVATETAEAAPLPTA